MDDWIAVGKVAKSHGLKGEMKLRPTVPDPKIIQNLSRVRLGIEGKEPGERVYESFGIRGHFSKLILKLPGVDSVESAKALTGQTVFSARKDFPVLPKGEHYWFEIIGLKVFDEEGQCFGEVDEILNAGGSEIYVVRDENREIMLPAVKDIIKIVDPEQGKLVFHRIEGLIEDSAI